MQYVRLLKTINLKKKTMKKLLLLLLCLGLCGCVTNNYELIRRSGYVNSHSNLSQDIKQCILEGSVRIGMTKEEVMASWGNPRDKQQHISAWGITEIWTTYDNNILTFFNNKLQSIYGDNLKGG